MLIESEVNDENEKRNKKTTLKQRSIYYRCLHLR